MANGSTQPGDGLTSITQVPLLLPRESASSLKTIASEETFDCARAFRTRLRARRGGRTLPTTAIHSVDFRVAVVGIALARHETLGSQVSWTMISWRDCSHTETKRLCEVRFPRIFALFLCVMPLATILIMCLCHCTGQANIRHRGYPNWSRPGNAYRSFYPRYRRRTEQIPRRSCFWLFRQAAFVAFNLARPSAGNNMPARIAMMAITTSSSMSVKPGRERRAGPKQFFVFINREEISIRLQSSQPAIPRKRLLYSVLCVSYGTPSDRGAPASLSECRSVTHHMAGALPWDQKWQQTNSLKIEKW